MSESDYGMKNGLKEGWIPGENILTRDKNPIKFRIKLALDIYLSGAQGLTPIEYNPDPGTGEQVVLNPRLGRPGLGHHHSIQRGGVENLFLREHDILHIIDAEGRVSERWDIAIFPKPQEK